MCTGAAQAFAGGASAACLLNVWLQTFACEFRRELASTGICFLLEEETSQADCIVQLRSWRVSQTADVHVGTVAK